MCVVHNTVMKSTPYIIRITAAIIIIKPSLMSPLDPFQCHLSNSFAKGLI